MPPCGTHADTLAVAQPQQLRTSPRSAAAPRHGAPAAAPECGQRETGRSQPDPSVRRQQPRISRRPALPGLARGAVNGCRGRAARRCAIERRMLMKQAREATPAAGDPRKAENCCEGSGSVHPLELLERGGSCCRCRRCCAPAAVGAEFRRRETHRRSCWRGSRATAAGTMMVTKEGECRGHPRSGTRRASMMLPMTRARKITKVLTTPLHGA